MASSSRPSRRESAAGTPTPAPSSPQPSESFLSELDGTAPSILETTADFQWDAGSSAAGPIGLDLVSWRRHSQIQGQGQGDGDGEDQAGVVDDLPTRGFYVINHPTKRANPLRSTRKPLPPIAPAPALPKPPPASHYDAYLQSVTPLYETFLANRPSGSGSAAASGSGSGEAPLTGAFDVRPVDPASTLPPLDAIPSAFFDTSFDLSDPTTWAEITSGGTSSLLGLGDADPSDPPPSSLPGQSAPNSAQRLQDALSSHLDTLERHLIHEITLRSTSFFSALSNLQDLHSESSSCLTRIRELQSGLKDIGTNTAQRGLEIIGKHEELAVMRVTEQGLDEIKQLEGVLDVTRTFVEADDWAGGLTCLGEIGEWWVRHLPEGEQVGVDATTGEGSGFAGAPDPDGPIRHTQHVHLPLSTLPALSALPQLFSDLRTQIALQLESSLHSYLLTTLSSAELLPHPGEGTDKASAAEAEMPAYDAERFQAHVAPMVRGLARCGVMDGVEGVWRDVVTLAVREGSRKHLPISQAEDEAEEAVQGQEMRGANLAQALRSMEHRRYLSLTAEMYQTMLLRLRLASTVGTDLLQVVQSTSEPSLSLTPTTHTRPDIVIHSGTPTSEHPAPPPLRSVPSTSSTRTSFDTPRISSAPLSRSTTPIPPSANAEPGSTAAATLDLEDILASACDLANLRASKILGVRGEQHAGLKIEEFVQVYRANWDFITRTEELGGRAIPSLRGVVAAQARTFLIAYHSHRLTRSAKLVEEEQWTQIEVSPEMQHAVQLLILSATEDPAECFVPPRTTSNGSSNNGEQGNGYKDATTTSKTLDVEHAKFFVVKATAESLELLSEYLAVVVNLEVVVTDVMARVIEFLKSFNSRTCQVVLGAGAMRSAGLKNITAKHLALASQSLSIVVSLIPYMREFIRRHLAPKQAVMLTEFDKLKRDYQEHQNEIHAKLVAIMSDRLAVHCGSLREIDWEAEPEKDAPRAYAELLVKETATLHKVLSKYLAAGTVENVMSEVLAAILHRLSAEYSRIELKSDGAKSRMSQDVTLISSRLAPLSEAGSTMSSLETLVKDKPVPRKTVLGGLLRRGSKKGNGAEGKAKGLDEEVEEEDMGDEEDEEVDLYKSADGHTEGGGKKLETGIAEDEPPNVVPSAAEGSTEDHETAVDAIPPSATSEGPVAGTQPIDAAAEPSVSETSPPPAPPAKDIPDAEPSVSPPAPPEKSTSPDPDNTPLATPQPTRIIDTANLTPLDGPVSPKSTISTTLPGLPSELASPTSHTGTTSPISHRVISPIQQLASTSPPPAGGSPVSRTSFSSFAASLRSPPPGPGTGTGAGPIASPSAAATAQASVVSPVSTPPRAPRVSLANRLRGVMTRSGSAEISSPPKALHGLPPAAPALTGSGGIEKGGSSVSVPEEQREAEAVEGLPAAVQAHRDAPEVDGLPAPTSIVQATADVVLPPPDASSSVPAKEDLADKAVYAPDSERIAPAAKNDASAATSLEEKIAALDVSSATGSSAAGARPSSPAGDTVVDSAPVSHAETAPALSEPVNVQVSSPQAPAVTGSTEVADTGAADIVAAAPVDVAETAAAALADDAEPEPIFDPASIRAQNGASVTNQQPTEQNKPAEKDEHESIAPAAEVATDTPASTTADNSEDDGDDAGGQDVGASPQTQSSSPAGKGGNKKNKKKKKGKK